jgi:hypothetical protein
MSNLLAIKKSSNSSTYTTLSRTDDFNSLDLAEKLKYLISARTAIEKEISYVEKDLQSFVERRNF